MKKNICKTISVTLVLVMILVSPLSVYGTNEDDQLFSKEEISEDTQILLEKLERIHPNLYFSANKEEINSKVKKALEDIDDPISDLEYYKRVAPILSMLNDGHTFTNYPDSFIKSIGSSENLIPIEVRIKNGKLFINRILTEEYLDSYNNYEVISINSKESIEIYKEMKNYVFGAKESFKESKMSQRFIDLYFLNNEAKDDYILELKDNNEQTIKLSIPGKSVNEVRTLLNSNPDNKQRKLYEYKVLENNIALIEFNSFTDFDGFKIFLDETFKDINEKGIKELIVDLRQNGGGNSSLGDLLVEYIYDGSYKSVSKVDIKISEEIIDYYLQNKFIGEKEAEGFKEIIGVKYNDSPSARRSYMDKAVFNGDTYFLIGNNSFSSAVMLAATVKDYNIGYLIGEETGGLATHYGDIYSFKLPNTKLSVGVSHKYFVRPNGLDTGKGVLPDYYQEDINKDPLDIAKEIIISKRQ